DRHGGEQFGDRGRVAGGGAGQPVHLGAEEQVDDLPLGGRHDLPVVGRFAGQPGEQLDQRPLAVGVDEQAGDPVERLVAGGALAGPVGGQPFSADEDLLYDRPDAAGPGAQPFEVAARVGEAV